MYIKCYENMKPQLKITSSLTTLKYLERGEVCISTKYFHDDTYNTHSSAPEVYLRNKCVCGRVK
jgi:hypothetical protein